MTAIRSQWKKLPALRAISKWDRATKVRTRRDRTNDYLKYAVAGDQSRGHGRSHAERPKPSLPRVRWMERPDPWDNSEAAITARELFEDQLRLERHALRHGATLPAIQPW